MTMCSRVVQYMLIILLVLISAMDICARSFRASIDGSPPKDQKASRAKPDLRHGDGKSGRDLDGTRRQALLRREAKITMDEAQEIARSAVPGDLTSGELTRDERGKPVYKFNLLDSENRSVAVQVSALSGRVLLVEREGRRSEFDLPKGIKRVPHTMKRKWSAFVRKIPI